MRPVYKILSFICFSCLFAACADLDRNYLKHESDFKAATVLAPQAINITAADIAEGTKVKFEWSAADFGNSVAVNYTIYGKYGAKTAELFTGLVGTTSHEVQASELYGKLSGLGIKDGETVSVSITVAATIGSNFKIVTSEEKTISVKIDGV